MQQTIVLLYAEVTVAMHSFDLKGVIHYRRDFTYSSFQTGKEELAKRVATVHAQAVMAYISKLPCPTGQKVALIDAMLEHVRKDIQHKKES